MSDRQRSSQDRRSEEATWPSSHDWEETGEGTGNYNKKRSSFIYINTVLISINYFYTLYFEHNSSLSVVFFIVFFLFSAVAGCWLVAGSHLTSAGSLLIDK